TDVDPGPPLEDLFTLVGGVMQIVLLTSLSSPEPVTDALAPGVLAALPKPPKHSRLRNLLQSAVEGLDREPARPRASSGVSRLSSHAPLLVVEDTPVNQAVIVGQLRRLGLAAQVVPDGREAVEAVARERFPLVLMDLHMPVMDGYEATEQIRRHPHGIGLPIIAVTANATEQV